jgi:hypothetical protein
LAVATVAVLIAAGVIGGRYWWNQQQTKKALAALQQEGADVGYHGSEVRVAAIDGALQDDDLHFVSMIRDPLQLTIGSSPTITDKGLAHLHGMTNIVGLDIGATSVTNEGMVVVGTLTGLQRLNISQNKEITDQGIEHVGKLVRLEELTMQGIPVTDAGIGPLKSLTELDFLFIRGTKVTRDGARELKDALPEAMIWSD